MRIISFSGIFCLVAVSILTPYQVSGQATISLNPSVTHQKIIGWEGTDTIGEMFAPTEFMTWRDATVDRLVNELGITRVRLETRSGVENPVDYFSLYLNGQLSLAQWRGHWHEAVNDNSNPSAIAPSGFQFAFIDFKIDNVIQPMRQLRAALGGELFVNLLYTPGDANSGGPGILHSNNPDEYAEFILAHFDHLKAKYGWVPDQVEIVNEPNTGIQWSPEKIGRALVATAQLLNSHGYHPYFGAPSVLSVDGSLTWFDQMVEAVPGVMTHLSELCYHRYGGDNLSNIQAIAARGRQYGIRTAMLEKFDGGGTYETLHDDLKHANVSAWQQFALAFPTIDNGAQYYVIDRSSPSNPVAKIGQRTKFLRQYFKFIQHGAQRIDAVSNNSAFDPVAFVNTDGGSVVVIKADAAGSMVIGGLSPGTYAATYTTNSEFNISSPEKAVAAGQTLTVSIPARGVITVYRTSATPPPPATDSSFLPQVGNGSSAQMGLRTELTFINTGNDTSLTVDFFDPSGQPMVMPFVQFGSQSRLTLSLRKGETVSVATSGAGALQVGYARLTTGPDVRGTAVFTRTDPNGTVLYEAGVPAVSPSGDFTVYLDSLQDKDTGLALVNSSTQSTAHVRIRLYDSEFQQKGETTFDLPAGRHRANFIWEFFQNNSALMQQAQESQGIVTVESDQPLAAVTLRQNGDPTRAFPATVPTLTAFPVAAGRADSSVPAQSSPVTFYFPQIGHGLDSGLQFETEMIFINTGTTASQINLDLFDSAGQPLSLGLQGVGANSTFQFSLQPGRAIRLITQGNTGLQVGYAKVRTTEGVKGTAVFTRRDAPSGVVLYEAGVPATLAHSQFTVSLDSTGNKDTGLAIVNPSTTTDANILVRLYNPQLQRLAETTVVLRAGRHMASFVWEIFEGVPGAMSQAREMQGVVTVSADEPLAAVTVRQNDDPLFDFPLSVPTLATFPVAIGVAASN